MESPCSVPTQLMPTHEKTSAVQFLATLDPRAQRFTFQFFGEGDESYAEVFHGTLDDVWPAVLSLNTPQRRIGVFITINETDFRGRRAENIVRPRGLFADADGEEQVQRCSAVISTTGARPTMMVRTSPGRAHFYWCSDDVPRDQFSALQSALIDKLGTDRAVKDLARVMRLPGTLHLKRPEAPTTVKLFVKAQPPRWTVDELTALLALSPAWAPNRTKIDTKAFTRADAERLRRVFGAQHFSNELGAGIETNIEEIKSAVAAIPPSAIATEESWVKFARGLAHEARVSPGQAEELWQVMDAASAAAPGYDAADNRRRWERYVDEALDRDHPITLGTVFDMAHKHGWTGWSPGASGSDAKLALRSSSFTSGGNAGSGLGALAPLGSGLAVSFSGIPHRRWLYGVELVVGEITVLAAPGGVGKSSLAVGICVALVTGKDLLEEQIYGGDLSALYINAEDSRAEMQRRVWAFCVQHGLNEQDIGRFLLLGSDDWRTQRISFLRSEKGTSVLDVEGIAFLETLLAEVRPNLLVLDPLVALCGGGNLNDNAAMSLVMRALKRLANKFDCAVLLLHHTRKGGDLSSAEAIGGASAIVNLARRALMAVPMTAEEAPKLGLLPSERFGCFKVASAKSNLAPSSGDAPWYKLCSVTLPNAAPPIYPHGDRVQAVVRVNLLGINRVAPSDDLAIRQAILDTVARGKSVDGENVQYSPRTTGADNRRSLLEDAMAAVETASAHRQWLSGDLEAVVKRAINGMQAEGWLVAEKIRSGRFRRSLGVRVDWDQTPWPRCNRRSPVDRCRADRRR
jgi:hypothetical protein